MNYFEKTGYSKEQNKKSITWEEVKNLPIYVKTKDGNLWHGGKIVPEKDIDKSCYIVSMSSKPIVLYFFEKATLKKMKGVKLRLMERDFYSAKADYSLGCIDRWIFITPDWKTYSMKGDLINIKNLEYFEQDAPSNRVFRLFRYYGHDLRNVGQFMEGTRRGGNCGMMMSPATVDILREVGFDMDTLMAATWQFKHDYVSPDDSYFTDWFVENLIHLNRVARRKKENSLIQHDYQYYCDLMEKKKFLVFEEEGQVYYSIRDNWGITVCYLKMPDRKAPSCVFYSDKGAKKLASSTIQEVFTYDFRTYNVDENSCENIINELLDKRQLLEKTEVFRNLIPTLEKAKEIVNNISPENRKEDSDPVRKICDKMYSDLSYILSPVGQKDRVFEETVKQNGLGKGKSAEYFLDYIGDYDTRPDLKQKTPYGQVGLTKAAYYGLRKLTDAGIAVSLRNMIIGFTQAPRRWYREDDMAPEEYSAKKLEFSPYLTKEFLNLWRQTMGEKRRSCYGISSTTDYRLLLRLAGKNWSSPLSEKFAAVTRILKKFLASGFSLIASISALEDYYRQIDELAPLGMNWPQKYEEFHVNNILWFLGTIRGNQTVTEAVNSAKRRIPESSFKDRIDILHDIQIKISTSSRLEIEIAALQQMDEEYAPWKKELRKALEWKGQNFGIFIPESLAELTVEGKILHHCVGSYKKDVALKKEGILFLRKLSCPNTPFYTLDVVKEPNGKYAIRQCHGDCNSNPTPEIVETLKKWAADTGKIDENSIENRYGALCCL